MARFWVYWLTIPHLSLRQSGSANVECYLDPPADALAEVALTAYQGGYASVVITNVNNTWGLADFFHYADRMWRVKVSMRAMGGPALGSINHTGARLIVRENEGGASYPPAPQQSMKSLVYDSKSGMILHSEEVFGSDERLEEFRGGKLDAQAHDYVKKELSYESKFDVMSAPSDFGRELNKTFKVDVKNKVLVPIKPTLTVRRPK